MKPDALPEDRNDSIIVECELPEPREKVWRALTVPEIVAEWLMPEARQPTAPNTSAAHGELRAGKANPAYEIITAERPARLQYRMREGREPAIESTVTFELSDTPLGGTHLRIVHEDFELAHSVAAEPTALCASVGVKSGGASTFQGTTASSGTVGDGGAEAYGALRVLRAYRQPRRARRATHQRSTGTRMVFRLPFKAAA